MRLSVILESVPASGLDQPVIPIEVKPLSLRDPATPEHIARHTKFRWPDVRFQLKVADARQAAAVSSRVIGMPARIVGEGVERLDRALKPRLARLEVVSIEI